MRTCCWWTTNHKKTCTRSHSPYSILLFLTLITAKHEMVKQSRPPGANRWQRITYSIHRTYRCAKKAPPANVQTVVPRFVFLCGFFYPLCLSLPRSLCSMYRIIIIIELNWRAVCECAKSTKIFKSFAYSFFVLHRSWVSYKRISRMANEFEEMKNKEEREKMWEHVLYRTISV